MPRACNLSLIHIWGQLLFIIDQVPYKAALKTAVANVEAARAALAEFRNHFLRIQFLVAVISQFGSSQCGTYRFHIGNGRFESSLVGNLVDDEEQLASASQNL